MNLLTDPWIPIQEKGHFEKITLQQLLCGEKTGEICLPRDDMELASLQLLCAITQVLFTPENKRELGHYVKQPLAQDDYQTAIQGKLDWFDLEHPETPFMQFRGVIPSKTEPYTSLEKLLAGVADGANKVFVNQQGLGTHLFSSCVAISLFNMANNAPSVGGGFQGSFRGNTPITTMIKGRSLREGIWLNVLTKEILLKIMPWYEETRTQKPNYVDKDKSGKSFKYTEIGLVRGLLWQPAHYELYPPIKMDTCSCCGSVEYVYTNFKKEKFKYTVTGSWPHPLSPRKFNINKGNKEFKFDSFTTKAPAWTHLSSFLYLKSDKKGGSEPSPIIDQAKSIMKGNRLNIIVGGYRYKPPQTATIIERRQELFSLFSGWEENEFIVREIIDIALSYKNSLRKSLYLFISQSLINAVSKKNKDRVSELCSLAEFTYYQKTENIIHDSLSCFDFSNIDEEFKFLRTSLKKIVLLLFDQATEPYQEEPKMIKALATARRSLHKSMKDLEPEGETHDKN